MTSVIAILGLLPGRSGLGQSAPAAGSSGPRLLVLSKRAHTLAIVNPANLQVEARVPVGDDPHEVIAAADGRRAYVSNYGSGALHTLAVVDLAGRKTLPPIELGALSGPHGLAVEGGKVWFTAEGAKVFGRYDPVTGRVDLVVGTGQDRTHMIAVSRDGQHVITTNVASGTVSFVDQVERTGPPGPPPGAIGPRNGAGPSDGSRLRAGSGPPPPQARPGKEWEQTVVRAGNGSEGFDVSPDGRSVWIGNAQDGTATVIDTTSRQVIATLPLDVPGVNRVKFTLDGRFVLLAGRGDAPLTIVDADSHAVVKRLRVGTGAAGMVMEPGGKRAFVACSPDNYVAVIDLGSIEMVGKIDAGGEPDGMAWAPGR